MLNKYFRLNFQFVESLTKTEVDHLPPNLTKSINKKNIMSKVYMTYTS